MTILLGVLAVLAIAQGCVSLRVGWRNARYSRTPGPVPSGAGPVGSGAARVVVFCPVKGAEADLDANARSLLAQNYADYRVIFLVDDEADPAVPVLGAIPGARVEAGGRSGVRSRKVQNLLYGVSRFGGEADVWVFADADARFPPDWLRTLVAPLGEPGVGAATGYRWYVPEPGSGASLLRSAWNATVAGFLGAHANNFAWGGSMAIRRAIFERADIGGLWEHAVSDDYALTSGVRALGLRVRYVPGCLVPAYGGTSWRELLEFTTRQIRITRVYAPRVWRPAFVSYTLFNVAFLWSLGAGIGGSRAALGAALVIYLLTVVRSAIRIYGIAGAIDRREVRPYRWFYLLSGPLVALLYQLNFVLSAASRRIVWKGVAYRMVSPRETLVEAPEEAEAGDG